MVENSQRNSWDKDYIQYEHSCPGRFDSSFRTSSQFIWWYNLWIKRNDDCEASFNFRRILNIRVTQRARIFYRSVLPREWLLFSVCVLGVSGGQRPMSVSSFTVRYLIFKNIFIENLYHVLDHIHPAHFFLNRLLYLYLPPHPFPTL